MTYIIFGFEKGKKKSFGDICIAEMSVKWAYENQNCLHISSDLGSSPTPDEVEIG